MNRKIFPQRVTIELTNRCNLACVFCHRTEVDMNLGNMTFDLYKKIIDEMSNHLPVAMVPFFRGESLLHPQFIEFIRYAKNKGISPVQMTTNGYLLNDNYARKIIESGIDFISFSMDTLDENKYNSSRVNGNLKRSMDNVLHFINLCNEYDLKGNKTPTIQVSTVDTDEYRNEQDEFIDFWKKYVDVVRVYEEHDINGRFRNRTLEKETDNIRRFPCRKLYTDMVINWDGAVSLCCYDWDEKHFFGDLNSKTILEIWNSESIVRLREMHEEGIISPDYLCYQCEYWKADYIDEKVLGKKIIGERKVLRV